MIKTWQLLRRFIHLRNPKIMSLHQSGAHKNIFMSSTCMIFSKVMSLIDDSEFFKSLSHIWQSFC